ncbi:hypothetical protein DIURU_004022 [Diutina rugosa]|uniref:methionyl-tRNA formyltransferase n=1 Tax=Diutina rugosa TaxID=5481 RepID=A0A642UQT3_DIURU|nr:uncharacterized protein DIURU_004022 [Diutina rugosa]KAA8899981.1 hypothetical protein DIURU_004022 [Diutina rugosa]
MHFTRVFTRSLSRTGLRIAFFGSDGFSVASLQHLHKLHQDQPGVVDAIDVVSRTIKPTGRGMKQKKELPIGECAQALGLTVRRADSADDIIRLGDENDYNMVVAVSYGQLIPAAFISRCEYGGLNVHPSLLPKYSGSSPIQYALLNDDLATGVTVQSLHPTKFDHGDIIVQSDPVAIHAHDNYASLAERLGDLGGRHLASVLANQWYLPTHPRVKKTYEFSLARKIKPAQLQINWHQLDSRQVKRMYDALGPLYTYKFVDLPKKRKQEYQRVILSGITEADGGKELAPGQFAINASTGNLEVGCADDSKISVTKVKQQCCEEETPAKFTGSLRKRTGDTDPVFEWRES